MSQITKHRINQRWLFSWYTVGFTIKTSGEIFLKDNVSSVWILKSNQSQFPGVRVRTITLYLLTTPAQDWASIYGAEALQGELQGRTCYIHFWLSFGQVWKTKLGESTGCAMCMCVCTWTGCLHLYVNLYEHIWCITQLFCSYIMFAVGRCIFLLSGYILMMEEHLFSFFYQWWMTQLSNILTNPWLSPPLDMFLFSLIFFI